MEKIKERAFKEGQEAGRAYNGNQDEIKKVCEMRKNSLIKELEPKIVRLKIEGSAMVNEEKVLAGSLSNSPTQIACRINFTWGSLWFSLSLIFLAGTWAIWEWSFAPFRLDHAKLLVLGLTALSAALGDFLINKIKKLFPEKQREIFLLFLVLAAFLFLLTAEVNFGRIRSSLARLSTEIHSTSVVEDTAANGNSDLASSANEFYKKGFRVLNVVMPLLALTLCLGTSVTFHEGMERLTTSAPTLFSYARLTQVRRKLINKSAEIKELEAMPDIFESEFLRGAMMPERDVKTEAPSQTVNPTQAISPPISEDRKLWIAIGVFSCALILILFFVSAAFSADSVIVAIDLTGSSRGKDYRGNEEFQKNMKAMESIIWQLQPGSQFRVIGITEDSFARPLILMDKRIGNDPGFFKEKLQGARQTLIKEWRRLSQKLRPDARRSDIFGAIALASQVFESQRNTSEILIILERHERM